MSINKIIVQSVFLSGQCFSYGGKILFKVEGAMLTTSNCKVLTTNCMRTNFLSIFHFFFQSVLPEKQKNKIIVFEIFSSQSIYGVSGLECAANKLKDPSL